MKGTTNSNFLFVRTAGIIQTPPSACSGASLGWSLGYAAPHPPGSNRPAAQKNAGPRGYRPMAGEL
jgi:hypothetical protein